MKKTILTSIACLVLGTATAFSQTTLLEFDFSGATNTAASNTQPSTFSAANVLATNMTRGAGISTNNAGNSFRGTGFSNDGIALSNTDFFQFTLAAAPGFQLSVESIFGNFNGTATFSASPGVTMAYAYSLNGGTSFTLMSSFVQIGSGSQTYNLTTAESLALTDVTSAVFRFYASGQTTTGGWGLQSAAAPGTIGLSVDGTVTVIPEPSVVVLLGLGLAFVLWRVRATRRQTA